MMAPKSMITDSMSSRVPSTSLLSFMLPPLELQTAITITKDGALKVTHSAPIPPLFPNGAIIRTAAVALNPIDAKILDFSPAPNCIAGYDFAGTVVALGDKALAESKLRIGDRVCGVVHGMNRLNPASGAFATYVSASVEFLLLVPDSMTWGEAATLGMGVSTAALALFAELDIPASLSVLGDTETKRMKMLKEEDKPFVLVVGGSTATGTRAIQLLKLAGLRPIATCSPKHFSLAKRFGASATFDYHVPTTASAIRAYTANELVYALDCITTAETTQLCYDSIGRAGGRYCALEPFRTAITSKRHLTITPSWLVALTIFGEPVALDGEYAREAIPMHRKIGVDAYAAVQRLLDRGLLDAHPARVVVGNWEDVIRGVEELRKQEVSGYKLVYVLS